MIFRNDLLEIEAIEKTALGPDPAAPSSFAPADVSVAETESLFVEKLKRLLQQNRPQADDERPSMKATPIPETLWRAS